MPILITLTMNTTIEDRPKVDYATLLGRCFGLHTSYEIGLLTRTEFLRDAHKIKSEYQKQEDAARAYWTKDFNEAITGDTKQ